MSRVVAEGANVVIAHLLVTPHTHVQPLIEVSPSDADRRYCRLRLIVILALPIEGLKADASPEQVLTDGLLE
ncbi:MAG: hypothetical protein DMG97_30480, partial [Acidobacteria bacterium]